MGESAYSRSFVLTPEMRQYFGRLFAPLSGIESGAYRGQEEPLWQLISAWPVNACLPSGLGKASVMCVWPWRWPGRHWTGAEEMTPHKSPFYSITGHLRYSDERQQMTETEATQWKN